MSFIFDIYHETYNKPTNLQQSIDNLGGNTCVGRKSW